LASQCGEQGGRESKRRGCGVPRAITPVWGTLGCPPFDVWAVEAVVPAFDLTVIGLYAPLQNSVGSSPLIQRQFWQAVHRMADIRRNERLVLVGDFNTCAPGATAPTRYPARRSFSTCWHWGGRTHGVRRIRATTTSHSFTASQAAPPTGASTMPSCRRRWWHLCAVAVIHIQNESRSFRTTRCWLSSVTDRPWRVLCPRSIVRSQRGARLRAGGGGCGA
jgi:hypothetical protein